MNNRGLVCMAEIKDQENDAVIIDQLYRALSEDDLHGARVLLVQMHPSEIADAMERLPGKARSSIWSLLSPDVEGDVLSELQVPVRMELLEDMKDTVLLAMDEQNRQRLRSILSYPEDTAGGLMNIDIVSVRAHVTLDVVMRYLRLLRQLPEQTDSLMVVDRENKYIGVLALTDILSKDPETTVREVK